MFAVDVLSFHSFDCSQTKLLQWTLQAKTHLILDALQWRDQCTLSLIKFSNELVHFPLWISTFITQQCPTIAGSFAHFSFLKANLMKSRMKLLHFHFLHKLFCILHFITIFYFCINFIRTRRNQQKAKNSENSIIHENISHRLWSSFVQALCLCNFSRLLRINLNKTN